MTLACRIAHQFPGFGNPLDNMDVCEFYAALNQLLEDSER